MKTRTGLILSLALLGLPLVALAQGTESRRFGDLLKRIPDQANVLMLVDVDALCNSPMGQRENWRAKATENQAGPLGIAGSVSKAAVSASFDLSTMNERWRIGQFQVSGLTPDIEELAAREGGYVEPVEGMPVAWTPRGFSLFRFTDNIVGFVTPAERQGIVSWVHTVFNKPRTFPPGYADRAVFKADNGYQIVLAVNLDHAISARSIEPWLGSIDQVKKSYSEPKLIAPRLSSIKSGYLAIKADQTLQGEIKVDFAQSLEGTAPVIRALVLRAFEDVGIDFPELKTWGIGLDSKNQSIVMEGRLSVESVRRICSLMSFPTLSPGRSGNNSAGATRPQPKPEEPKPATPAEDSETVALKASQAYYRAVAGLVTDLKSTNRPTYRAAKVWYDRSAKQIDELPILNVDKELLDWGSVVSKTFREMSTGINYYAQNQSYTLASSSSGAYQGSDGYTYAGSRAYDQAVIKRQSDAMMSVDLDKRWQAIEISVGELRRKMVEKYKVDF